MNRTTPTGSPAATCCADRVPAMGASGDCAKPSDIAAGAPPPRDAAISAGGAPKVGLPIRLTDRVLGLGRFASDLTADPGGTVASALGGGAANCGGRDGGVGPSRGELCGAGGTEAVCGGGGGTGLAEGWTGVDDAGGRATVAAAAGGVGAAAAGEGGGGGGGVTALWRLIVSSEYFAFSRSAVSCSARRLRSSSVGAAGLSGTDARFGNFLSPPGVSCSTLASLGLADSGSSLPEIASAAPSYHSTGFAQSGTDEHPASSAAANTSAPAVAKFGFFGDSEFSALSMLILCRSLLINTNSTLTTRPATAMRLLCNAANYVTFPAIDRA